VLDQASSRTRICNAFGFAWPGKVDREERDEALRSLLLSQTVATIRSYGLFAEVAKVVGRTERDVRTLLSAHHGHRVLKNIQLDGAERPAAARKGDASDLVEVDEKAMLSLLPEDGSAIGNGNLRGQLGWDDDR